MLVTMGTVLLSISIYKMLEEVTNIKKTKKKVNPSEIPTAEQ